MILGADGFRAWVKRFLRTQQKEDYEIPQSLTDDVGSAQQVFDDLGFIVDHKIGVNNPIINLIIGSLEVSV